MPDKHPHPLERRSHRRFNLHYPVAVRFMAGGVNSELHCFSDNVSLGGILFESDYPLPLSCQVSFTMMVEEHHLLGTTSLVGEGEVLRVEPSASGEGFAVAVKCRRPLSKLEDCLPASAS